MKASIDFFRKARLYKLASALALVTISYNLLEGMVSVYFGLEDETIALFGFGVDSFVEVISGIGIWHMVRRLRQINENNSCGNDNPDIFERQALRITGTAFYILAGGLVLSSLINLYTGHKPSTTFWGIVISLISILTMWILIHYKVKVGRELNSNAILADATCTKVCLQLSLVLLLSSLGYELTGIGGMDSLGAMGIAIFSYKEGREAFDKVNSLKCKCNFT